MEAGTPRSVRHSISAEFPIRENRGDFPKVYRMSASILV